MIKFNLIASRTVTTISFLAICCTLPINVLAVEVCGRYDTIQVKGGEYIVQNNVWGATTAQCITVSNANVPSFKVSKSEHNSTTVASYPSIFKGCHWGKCSINSGMPILANQIGKAKFVWNVTPAATLVGNIAAEAWLSPNRDTSNGYEGGAELMIWLDAKGGMVPAGEQVATVNIAGDSWEVWFDASDTGHNWNYIAYRRTSSATSVDLDLNDFIKDAIARGYIASNLYLHDLEAGTEIMSGGLGFTTNNFSFSVLPCGLPIVTTNAPSLITFTSARLSGTVKPNGAATTTSFNFGPTTAYGTNIIATPATIAATAVVTNVSANKIGLVCNTTYNYRIKAVNSAGTTYGKNVSFRTAACLPDLVITNTVLTPASPVANGTFTATVTVKNQGMLAGDGKFLDVWSHQPAAKVCGAVGNKRLAVGVVAKGAFKTLTFTGLPASITGAKTFRAFVDSGCGTAETNEGNNQIIKSYTVK